jgi:hypothetical protein
MINMAQREVMRNELPKDFFESITVRWLQTLKKVEGIFSCNFSNK